MGQRLKVILVTTSPQALWAFFQNQVRFLAEQGLAVETVSSPGAELDECRAKTGVPMHEVAMRRDISLFSDLRALFQLWLLFVRRRPDVVHTHTPKAGLLGMIAAMLAGVRVRIYTINGLRFETLGGWKRSLLRLTVRVSCLLATDVLCVSPSLREVAVAEKLCPAARIQTLGHGGSHGIDLERFDPRRVPPGERDAFRARYGIAPQALVAGFVGRIVRDKGIEDLAGAWKILRDRLPALELLICGDFDRTDPIPAETARLLEDDARVHLTREMIGRMEAAYSAIDVCVLPSWREGLPNVALESQAMEVPVVATRIPGCRDAVVDGVTGFLVERHDPGGLAAAIGALALDPVRRRRFGEAGRLHVSERFSETALSKLLLDRYRRLAASPRSALAAPVGEQ